MKKNIPAVLIWIWAAILYAAEPQITLFSPVNNMITVKNKVLLKGIVEPGALLTINDEPVEVKNNGRFYIKKPLLNSNAYTLFKVIVTTKEGNQRTITRQVYYKRSANDPAQAIVEPKAEIVITSPKNNEILTAQATTIEGKLLGATHLTINDTRVSLEADGSFAHPIKLANKDDKDILYIEAFNEKGESQTLVRHNLYYKVKKDGPVIQLETPQYNSVQKDLTITFSGKALDAKSLKINGKSVKLSQSGNFLFTTTVKKAGKEYAFKLVAIGSKKHKAVLTRTVYVLPEKEEKAKKKDKGRIIPEILMEFPENNRVTYKHTVTLKGTVVNASKVFINDRHVVTDEKGQFSETFQLSQFGKYSFDIQAIGNNNLTVRHFHHVFRIEKVATKKKPDQQIASPLDTLVSLNLAGTDLKDVVGILAKKAGLNMVTDQSLTGLVHISLNDVRAIDAIDYVLSSKGFSYHISGNTIMIGSKTVLDRPSRIRTKVIRLDNTTPKTVMPILKPYLVAGESIQAQENLLVVMADAKKMETLSNIIQRLDADKIPQIILEAHILEVSQSALDNLGIAFSGKYSAGAEFRQESGTNTDTLSLSNLSAIINLLATEGKAKIISKPKIKAIHGQKAEIFIGDKEPYIELTTGAGGNISESINYVNVGINLTVLPEINAYTKEIKIKISPEVSYINGYKGKNNDIPVVRTRRVNTTVVVKNENTVLIGGLFKSSDQDAISRVPILSRVPLLGLPFKSNKKEDEQTELVIAITPKIIDDTFKESIPIPIPVTETISAK